MSDSSEDSVHYLELSEFENITFKVQNECLKRRMRIREIREEEREMERRGICKPKRSFPTTNTSELQLIADGSQDDNINRSTNPAAPSKNGVAPAADSYPQSEYAVPLTSAVATSSQTANDNAFPPNEDQSSPIDQTETKSSVSLKISNSLARIGKLALSQALFGSTVAADHHSNVVNDLNHLVCPIPPSLNERDWEDPLQPQSKLNINETFLVIISFLPEDLATLKNVGLVCRAWRERTNYLPQWHNLTINILKRKVGNPEVSLWSVRLTKNLKDKLATRFETERNNKIAERARAALLDPDVDADDANSMHQPEREDSMNESLVRNQISAVVHFGISSARPAPPLQQKDISSPIDSNEGSVIDSANDDRDGVGTKPVAYPEYAAMYLTRDDFVEQQFLCTELMKAHEKNQSNYWPSCERFCDGAWAFMCMIISLAVSYLSAFFAGYNHNGLDTDVKFGLMYYFTFMMVWGVMVGCSKVKIDESRSGNIGLFVWGYISIMILGLILGLLGMRLATVSYLESKPSLYATRCPAYNDGIDADGFGPYTTPQSVTFDGLQGWEWSSQDRVVVNIPQPTESDANATTPIYVMMMVATTALGNITNGSLCGGTLLPRQVAFLCPNASIYSGYSYKYFSTADLPLNPLAVHAGTTMELRVPMRLKYDDPFDYPDVVQWSFDTWYDRSPLWLNARVPLLPLTGLGTITQMDPHGIRTPNQIRWDYMKGVIGIALTGVGISILVGLGFMCPKKSCRNILRVIAFLFYSLIINPITMMAWGATCYFGTYESCLMSNQSALALFISGLTLTVTGITITVILICTSD